MISNGEVMGKILQSLVVSSDVGFSAFPTRPTAVLVNGQYFGRENHILILTLRNYLPGQLFMITIQ